MNKRNTILAALALILVICVSVGPALAYFTDYAVVKGSHPLKLVPWTEITEEVPTTGSKEVSITNYGEVPCWVRVRVFADGAVTDLAASGSGWSADGEGWTCGTVVMPGAAAPTLKVTFQLPSPEAAETANVVVVYESVPAYMGSDGAYQAANWSEKGIEYTETVPGNGGQG